MFSYNQEKLNALAENFLAEVHREFAGDEFAKYAAVGKLLGKDSLMDQWPFDYLWAERMAPTIDSLLKIHDALSKAGITQTNGRVHDIGSCDRFATAHLIGIDAVRVLGFENQNYSYMVALVPTETFITSSKASTAYTMHIRVHASPHTDFSYLRIRCLDQPLEDFGRAAEKERYGSDYHYLRYHDLRDTGYVMTLVPNRFDPDAVGFYRAEDQYRNHPLSRGVFEEILAYHSAVKGIVKEIEESSNVR